MSLNTINSIATSGLYAAQQGINTVSDNITNVNTTGYVRKVVNQNSLALQGQGMGTGVSGVSRAADQFLENASLSAAADVGKASSVSDLLDQAQSILGDPGASTGYFNQINTVFSAFAAAANNPTSSLSASQAVNQVTQFLNQSQSAASSLSALSTQADSRMGADVTSANDLLSQISDLNGAIARSSAQGADASDAQNAQSTLITQLSSMMDVQVARNSLGGVSVTTGGGQSLVGQLGAAKLAYNASTSGASQLTIVQPGGANQPVSMPLQTGEMRGLLDLRNTTLPGIQNQLSELVTQTVNALNKAHNASSSVPAQGVLTGNPVSTDIATAVSGFTGKTSIVVVNSSGVPQQQVDIDFSAGTMTSGGVSTTFGPSNFVSVLNSTLSPAATATTNTANNTLTISAANTGDGVAIQDDATTPSNKNGQGFSQYFGLNNLVSSSVVTNYQTGLKASDSNGFNSGGNLTLRLSDNSGSRITDVNVAVPSGGTVQDVVDALNATTGGVGIYGKFTLDGTTGELSFSPTTPGSASVSVVSDNTTWGSGANSLTQIFGVGAAQRATRTASYAVRSDIAAQPSKLAFAQLDLTAAAGQPVLSSGDGSGALALSKAGDTVMSFSAAGSIGAISTTVSQYASQLAGSLGTQASGASTAKTNAQAVQKEAESRRQSVEGVNLDQELVSLTTYQQAYSASARLVTATKDMFTALLNMVGG
ncbi:MAG: flagellar hook-associated protein FlgK [Caulobacteraceae bacterium]|nr:flagellar hook-associated protein FlgK [Caulobacteraceae bacterium]